MPDNPVGNPREHQSQTITTTDPRVLMRGDVDATETLDKLVERLSVKPRAFNDLLPPDVLAFLFEALLQVCIDEDMAKYDRLTTVQKLPILVVSHVSASWRTVAHDIPSLWSVIGVNDLTRRKMLEMVVSRSKGQPLEIEVDLTPGSSKRYTKEIVNILVSEVHRWRKLSWLSCQDRGLEIPLTRMEGKTAPLLEFLYLDDEGSPNQDYEEVYSGRISTIFDGPESLPRLQTLELGGTALSWRRHPFHDLVKLEICYIPDGAKPSLRRFLGLLRSCPSLQTLIIKNGAVKTNQLLDEYERPDIPADLSTLDSLTLCDFDHPDLLSGTLRCFHAPNLHHLSIQDVVSDEDRNPMDFGPAFEVLASTNLPLLHSLELLRFVCCSPDILEQLFCGLPQLRRLHVEHDTDGDAVSFSERTLRAFLDPSTRMEQGLSGLAVPIACPVLEELKTCGVSGDALTRIAMARAALGHPLRRILHSRAHLGPGNLDDLVDIGVVVEGYNEDEGDQMDTS